MASIPGSTDIVVVGKREPKPTLAPTLVIEINGGGVRNGVIDFFAGIFRSQSKLGIDPAFSVKNQRLIREVLKRIKNDPDFAAAYQAMESKDVAIFIHPVTRSDQINDTVAQGGTFGKTVMVRYLPEQLSQYMSL